MRFIFILALFFIISCGEKDATKPVITILQPKYNDTISVGTDKKAYEFKVTDNDQLMNVSFVIKDSANTKFAQGNKFINSNLIAILDSNYYGGFSGIKKVMFIVQAYDKSYNQIEVTQIFYIKP